MSLVTFLLICVAVLLLGAISGKPVGWVVVILATLALLLALVGGVSFTVGR